MQNPAPASLAQAAIGDALVVRSVSAPAFAPEWASWLEEIGFMPGERVCVMARGLPGADPLVIRIGQSTFALRRAEAECVSVMRPLSASASSGHISHMVTAR
jgi:ferrous iron transport protein A